MHGHGQRERRDGGQPDQAVGGERQQQRGTPDGGQRGAPGPAPARAVVGRPRGGSRRPGGGGRWALGDRSRHARSCRHPQPPSTSRAVTRAGRRSAPQSGTAGCARCAGPGPPGPGPPHRWIRCSTALGASLVRPPGRAGAARPASRTFGPGDRPPAAADRAVVWWCARRSGPAGDARRTAPRRPGPVRPGRPPRCSGHRAGWSAEVPAARGGSTARAPGERDDDKEPPARSGRPGGGRCAL